MSYRFSTGVTSVDICAVGGGGGGGSPYSNAFTGADTHCNGGGGGYVSNALGVPVTSSSTMQITIGAGGSSSLGASGGNGGKTTVTVDGSVKATANGGNGGTTGGPGGGNGNGGKLGGWGRYDGSSSNLGNPTSGTNGSGYKFNDSSLGVAGGGGGGGGCCCWNMEDCSYNVYFPQILTSRGNKGSPNGGMGSWWSYSPSREPLHGISPTNGSTPGGGGGGGGYVYGECITTQRYTAGRGGSGAVYLRFNR